MRVGNRLVRVLSYLLVSGSLVVAAATGDRGWRDVINVVLFAEFLLGWGGVMLNAPLEGMKTAQDIARGRLIVSGVYLLMGLGLVGVLLSHRSFYGLIYGFALFANFRDAWRPDTDREGMALRSGFSLMVLIATFAGVSMLAGQGGDGAMLTGLIYFTVLPVLDALLLSRVKRTNATG